MKNKLLWAVALLIIIVTAFFYLRQHQSTQIQSSILQTTLKISVYGPGAADKARAAQKLADKLSEELNWFDPQTDLGAINSLAGKAGVTANPDLFNILKIAHDGTLQTNGAFDVTTDKLLVQKLPSSKFLSLNPKNRLVKLLKEGTEINLSGIAKGYTVQKTLDLLAQKGAAGALVEIGASIGVIGKKPDGKPWKTGIRHPKKQNKLLGTLILESGQSLSTCGGDEKIIDPRSGSPANKCQSVTVIYNDAALADLYSTAIFIMGPWDGFRFADGIKGLKVLIVKADGNLITSPGLNFEREDS